MIAKVDTLRIFICDLTEAITFYHSKLGMKLVYESEDQGWAELELDNLRIGLEVVEPDTEEYEGLVGRFVGISFRVQDIQDAFNKLKEKGVEFEEPPAQQDWGGWLCHFTDPDGNVLSLTQEK